MTAAGAGRTLHRPQETLKRTAIDVVEVDSALALDGDEPALVRIRHQEIADECAAVLSTDPRRDGAGLGLAEICVIACDHRSVIGNGDVDRQLNGWIGVRIIRC